MPFTVNLVPDSKIWSSIPRTSTEEFDICHPGYYNSTTMKTAPLLVVCLVLGLCQAHQNHHAEDERHGADMDMMDNSDMRDMMNKRDKVTNEK